MRVAVHALPAQAVEREQPLPLLQCAEQEGISEHAGPELVVVRVAAPLIVGLEVRGLVSARAEPAVERAEAALFLRGAVEQACRREDFRRLFRLGAARRSCRRVCLARQQFH